MTDQTTGPLQHLAYTATTTATLDAAAAQHTANAILNGRVYPLPPHRYHDAITATLTQSTTALQNLQHSHHPDTFRTYLHHIATHLNQHKPWPPPPTQQLPPTHWPHLANSTPIAYLTLGPVTLAHRLAYHPEPIPDTNNTWAMFLLQLAGTHHIALIGPYQPGNHTLLLAHTNNPAHTITTLTQHTHLTPQDIHPLPHAVTNDR